MGIDTSGGHRDMDYDQHVGTYTGFVRGSVVVIVAILVILSGMAIFLT